MFSIQTQDEAKPAAKQLDSLTTRKLVGWQVWRTIRRYVWIVPVIQLLVMLWVIWAHSANVPYWDEWETELIVQHFQQGTLSLYEIWVPHAFAHRIVLPRLINLAVIEATNWNRQIEMMVNVALGAAGGWLFYRAVQRTLGRNLALALVVPLSLIYLSLSQFANWFAPFQIALILDVFGVACIVWALSREQLSGRHLAIAIVGSGVATLSTLQGVLPWVAFAPVILLVGGYRKAAIWVACGAAAWLAYFSDYPHHPLSLHLKEDFLYTMAYLGAPVSYQHPARSVVVGLISVVLLLGNLIVYWRVGGNLKRLVPWLGIAVLILACTQATALGRADHGFGQALSSRYQALSALWWMAEIVVGAAVMQELWTSRATRGGTVTLRTRRMWQATVAVNLVALVLAVVGAIGANIVGTRDAVIWQDTQRGYQHFVINYDSAPLSCLAWYYLPPEQLPPRAAYLEQHHMGVWAIPGTVRIPAAQAPVYSTNTCPSTKPYSPFIDDAGRRQVAQVYSDTRLARADRLLDRNQ